MEFSEYQRAAKLSDQWPDTSTQHLVIPALGLVAEAGSLAQVFKRWLRDGTSLEQQKDLARVELGDVLWYLANLASRFDLSLDEIAEDNLARARDNYGHERTRWDDPSVVMIFDDEMPEAERFPRKMVFEFKERPDSDGAAQAEMRLVYADPNPFPGGRDFSGSPKGVGFTVGDSLRDNSAEEDGYRYHDALHLGFLAVLGWSPVFRSLLRLKRKSISELDDVQDSLRAIDVEEGLTTRLAKRASSYENFRTERHVDTETISGVKEHVQNLEASKRPGWLWRIAISEGFNCMGELRKNRGGYLALDLDTHSIKYSKLDPSPRD